MLKSPHLIDSEVKYNFCRSFNISIHPTQMYWSFDKDMKYIDYALQVKMQSGGSPWTSRESDTLAGWLAIGYAFQKGYMINGRVVVGEIFTQSEAEEMGLDDDIDKNRKQRRDDQSTASSTPSPPAVVSTGPSVYVSSSLPAGSHSTAGIDGTLTVSSSSTLLPSTSLSSALASSTSYSSTDPLIVSSTSPSTMSSGFVSSLSMIESFAFNSTSSTLTTQQSSPSPSSELKTISTMAVGTALDTFAQSTTPTTYSSRGSSSLLPSSSSHIPVSTPFSESISTLPPGERSASSMSSTAAMSTADADGRGQSDEGDIKYVVRPFFLGSKTRNGITELQKNGSLVISHQEYLVLNGVLTLRFREQLDRSKFYNKSYRPNSLSTKVSSEPFINTEGNTNFLVAVGVGSRRLSFHGDNRMSLAVNLFTGEVDTEVEHKLNLLMIHALLMSLAFGLFFPIGVLVARFGKGPFPPGNVFSNPSLWFKVHVSCQVFGNICTIVGLVYAPHVLSPYNKLHKVMGGILIGLVFLQLINGVLRPGKGSNHRSKWKLFHAASGLPVPPVGFANIFVGLMIIDENFLLYALPILGGGAFTFVFAKLQKGIWYREPLSQHIPLGDADEYSLRESVLDSVERPGSQGAQYHQLAADLSFSDDDDDMELRL